MSKYLDEVIEEMGNYADMGMPDGESSMGMGDAGVVGVRGKRGDGEVVKAYRLNDLLRTRNRAEEEEDFDPMDMGDDSEFDDMEDDDVEETKQFFLDNPEPSDEDIQAYADEQGMDLEDMRKAVYRLIRSLLATETPDDEMDVDMDDSEMDDDEVDFSVSGDTGERPASNEMR